MANFKVLIIMLTYINIYLEAMNQELAINCICSNTQKKLNEKSLYYACKNGNLETVKKLIRSGINVNSYNFKNNTPLHKAIKHQHREIAKELLSVESNPNFANSHRVYPIFWATKGNQTELVKLLISHKADVNIKCPDNHECSLVHFASCKGYTDIVKELIKAGANINVHNKIRYYPIDCALSHEAEAHIIIAKELIKAGAIYSKANLLHNKSINDFVLSWNKSVSEFFKAYKNLDYSLLKQHTKNIDINMRDRHGNTLLIKALINGDEERILWLLDHEIETDTQNYRQESPLSISNSMYNIIKYYELLKYELIQALDNFNLARISFLIKMAPPILLARLDKSGNTALHYAINKYAELRSFNEKPEKVLDIIKFILNKDTRLALVKNYFNISSLELSISQEHEILKIIIDTAYVKDNKRKSNKTRKSKTKDRRKLKQQKFKHQQEINHA